QDAAGLGASRRRIEEVVVADDHALHDRIRARPHTDADLIQGVAAAVVGKGRAGDAEAIHDAANATVLDPDATAPVGRVVAIVPNELAVGDVPVDQLARA